MKNKTMLTPWFRPLWFRYKPVSYKVYEYEKISFFFSILFLIGACAFSFWLGRHISDKEKDMLVEGITLNALGDTLSMLRYFDQNKPGEVKHLLQAQTGGQLSWLIQFDQANLDSDFSKQRCKTLNTLTQYREKNQLFNNKEWTDLLSLPGAKKEEEKRVEYLSSLECGQDTF